MKRFALLLSLLLVAFLALWLDLAHRGGSANGRSAVAPAAAQPGTVTLDEALAARRSVRSFRPETIRYRQVARILWAAQGVTDARGFRTAPSAGGKYPLEVYVAAARVTRLPAGLYRYRADTDSLVASKRGDLRSALAAAAHQQGWIESCAAVIVIAGAYSRTTAKYGERGVRYVHVEAGCALQSLLLEAAALGLGACPVGGFDDGMVREALGLPPEETPLLLVPVGKA